jgi:hypothetical protein
VPKKSNGSTWLKRRLPPKVMKCEPQTLPALLMIS